MPRIIPIKDLKDTGKISELCSESKEPVYITKNGYGNMVIMSMEVYEKTLYKAEIYAKLEEADKQIAEGRVLDADASLKALRSKYNV